MSDSRLSHEREERIPFLSSLAASSEPSSSFDEQTLELRVRNSPLPTELSRKFTSEEQNKRKRLTRTPSDLTFEYVEHEIKPGETLQGISLQYRIPVFELKRQNNIDKENEFYARRSIKIPVKIHSLLTEGHRTVPTANLVDLSYETETDPSAAAANGVPASEAFLAHVDQDLERLKRQTEQWDATHTAAEPPPLRIRSNTAGNATAADCGADCGLSWLQVLGLALVVLLLCPLLYFLYIELGKPENFPSLLGFEHGQAESLASNT